LFGAAMCGQTAFIFTDFAVLIGRIIGTFIYDFFS
jgi:hypothetical protein